MRMKINSQLNSYKSKQHYEALASFYGLMVLFTAVNGVLVFAIYKDWQYINHSFSALRICPTVVQNHFFHLATMAVLIVLLFVIIYLFLRSVVKHWVVSISIENKVANSRLAHPATLDNLLDQIGISKQTSYVNSDVPLAFTCGLFQPQIVISKGLFSSLNMAELKAVLLHERYHLKHFDPLKLSLVKSVRSALFFLHLAGHLCRCYEQLKELAADSSAISQIGEKVHLASALLKMLQYARPSSGAVLLVETNTAVDLRIAQLLSDKRPTLAASAKVQLFGSSLLLFASLTTFLTGCV